MRHGKRYLYAAAIILSVVMTGVPVWAEEEAMPDTFMLRLGGYTIRNASTIVRLDSANYPVGAYIDFSETLGGDTTASVGRLDGLFRVNENHGIGLAWYSVEFTGSRVLGKDINWGDQVYPLSTQVDSELKFDVYKLNYQYSLFHNEEAELGASFGFHIMKTFVSLNAIGISQSKSESITAPLPVFGLFADYNFTPRFSAYYNYQFFFVNYDDKIKGGLQDFLIGLEYRLFRHVALGAAYNRFGLRLESKGDRTTLNLNTNWNGGMLYGAVYF